ncbi:MAG: hypothetical protein V4608_14220 [Bacteroidota bacterium]
MYKKKYYFVLLLVWAFSGSNNVSAQNNSGWEPIYLQVTGANTMDGVEASFQMNTCNGEDVLCIKFINRNKYPVKLEWFDAVFTQELKWINKDQPENRKTITLPAETEAKGSCSSNAYPELTIKLKDFIAGKKDFKRYSASQLRVISVQ